MRLSFTAKALDDLKRLHAFVAEKNPAAADRIRSQLLDIVALPYGDLSIPEVPISSIIHGDQVIVSVEVPLTRLRSRHGASGVP